MSNENTDKAEHAASGEAHERMAYESLRSEVKKRLAEIKDAATADNIRQAIDQATDRLRTLGGHTAEALNKAHEAVRRDLAMASRRVGPSWTTLSEQTADLFAVWKDRGNSFLGQAATSVGEWLQRAGERIERTTYRTGDLTYGGTFTCAACGQQVILSHSGHLPPCPKCMATEFRRV